MLVTLGLLPARVHVPYRCVLFAPPLSKKWGTAYIISQDQLSRPAAGSDTVEQAVQNCAMLC